jgi:hypothetical protein
VLSTIHIYTDALFTILIAETVQREGEKEDNDKKHASQKTLRRAGRD